MRKRVDVYLTKERREELKALAEMRGISVSALVRRIVQEELEKGGLGRDGEGNQGAGR